MRIGECMFFSRCFDLGALLLDLLLDDELVLVEGFLDLAIGHLSILHFKLKLCARTLQKSGYNISASIWE